MKSGKPRFEKYLFVCENRRDEGDCCMPQGAEIRENLKEAVKRSGLASRIRVSRSGCLDLCAAGPNVLLMPDNRHYSAVTIEDVEAILEEAAKEVAR